MRVNDSGQREITDCIHVSGSVTLDVLLALFPTNSNGYVS